MTEFRVYTSQDNADSFLISRKAYHTLKSDLLYGQQEYVVVKDTDGYEHLFSRHGVEIYEEEA